MLKKEYNWLHIYEQRGTLSLSTAFLFSLARRKVLNLCDQA